eukprot:CAMPEP_0170527666 /NCGR_PEP_ID=MMETSP0209-20121228/13148_1 /TAXON_ID=665100 ORGANISM="Litonotus pictus, Strain P1" /NCGR_SAMPLE_ID=MMETSP0209 /ASSEMBLY_ACC=CAM_ASM_000301 /LENGTH=262 /DNA_ID=CAMNT_0010818359 /DNA_START=302 /DNA_END=1090 /DNA_ORIENTATION=+
MSNILTDLKFDPIKWSLDNINALKGIDDEVKTDADIQIHRGFLEAYCTIKSEINALLEPTILNGIETVIFTGHSLGGALSSISALDFKHMLERAGSSLKTHLITFGAPRVGNQVFVDQLNNKLSLNMRIVYDEDIVPEVPGAPFVHPGDLVTIKPNSVTVTLQKLVGDSSKYYTSIHQNDDIKSILLKSLEVTCIEAMKYALSFICQLDEKLFLERVKDHSQYKSMSDTTLTNIYNRFAETVPTFNTMRRKHRRTHRKFSRK